MALDGSGAAVDDRLKRGRGVWALQRSERVEFHDGDLTKEVPVAYRGGAKARPAIRPACFIALLAIAVRSKFFG